MGAHRAVLILCRVQVDRGRVRVTMHDCTKLGLYSRLYMRFSPDSSLSGLLPFIIFIYWCSTEHNFLSAALRIRF